MNVLVRYIVSIILTLATSRAFAQVFGDVPDASDPANATDRASSVIYKSAEAGKTPVDIKSAEPVANLIEAQNRSLKSRIFRVDNRVASGESSNDFLANDRSTFSINTPTRSVNNALSFVGTVAQAPLSTTTTRLIQVLSMLSSRKANLQLAYLAPLTKNSRFESSIDCRLSNAGSNVAVMARMQYVMTF